MRLINKRYRILSKLTKSRNGSYYKVKDIYENDIKILKFFNSDKYSQHERENFKKEYLERSNIGLPCFNETDDFSKIWNIDDNDLNSEYCFYTVKYEKNGRKLSS